MDPTTSRKRTAAAAHLSTPDSTQVLNPTTKRQKLDQSAASYVPTYRPTPANVPHQLPSVYVPSNHAPPLLAPYSLPTPSSAGSIRRLTEAPKPPKPTLNLKLDIPVLEPPPSSKAAAAQRKLEKQRRAAARKWESRLQDPFPEPAEIKRAYDGKMLRHYTSPLSNPLPAIQKPEINKSTRVTNLLKQFPALNVPTLPSPNTTLQFNKTLEDQASLNANLLATSTPAAKKSAWKNFSTTQYTMFDAMVESGLPREDLGHERNYTENRLPGWRKCNTSDFARDEELRKERDAMKEKAAMEDERRFRERKTMWKLLEKRVGRAEAKRMVTEWVEKMVEGKKKQSGETDVMKIKAVLKDEAKATSKPEKLKKSKALEKPEEVKKPRVKVRLGPKELVQAPKSIQEKLEEVKKPRVRVRLPPIKPAATTAVAK
jgi:hypothetical protein